jgi:peptidoglycan/xylan/chitin deacetylase (PgdA/CDA1 family)
MQTVYPDYRHYTLRDEGSRVAIYRLLEAAGKVDAKLSVGANGAISERYPALIRDIVSAGHEIIAHSTDMHGTIATGIVEAAEAALIASALAILRHAASARRGRNWLSVRLGE